jgi:hypothetical protein
VGSCAPRRIIGPGLRQVERTVDQCMAVSW